MTAPTITPAVVPTGGAIALAISGAVSGTATLSRAVSGQGFTQFYSGGALAYYVDCGDGTPAPLDPTLFYNYQYTDDTGTVTSEFLQPVSSLVAQPEQITQTLIRLLQGGLAALNLPANISKLPEVTHAMPLGGNIALPLVVISQDLFQQDETSIGDSLQFWPGADPAIREIIDLAKRTYRVSVLCTNAIDRDFFREAIVAIFRAIWQTVLVPLGLDVKHRWQVSSGQVAKKNLLMEPGFYYCDIMLEFTGSVSLIVTPNYGLIETITTAVTGQGGMVDETEMPVIGPQP